MIIQVCVGSSCHLKGSPEIVELLTKEIQEYNLESEIELTGSFCIGKCNRQGVTIQVDDEIYLGITRESCRDFFEKKVLSAIKKERE